MPRGDTTSLAVIPARGGSKRILRKNLRAIGGTPLVLWTVRAAQESNLTRFAVSTEDTEIADVCRGAGAAVVERPDDLAGDYVWSAPVVIHALEQYAKEGFRPDLVMLLHPTSPFRTAYDIDRCLDMAAVWPGSVISFTNDDLNGAIYVSRTDRFLADGTFFRQPILPYEMNDMRGLDIDYPEDLELAREFVEGAAVA